MKILQFLFLLGVCFTIFEFIWGLFKFAFNFITSSIKSPVKTNALRIVKYILFVGTTIQFIKTINIDSQYIHSSAISISIGAILMTLYLIGKFQNRAAFAQIKSMAGQMMKGFSTSFDSKLEVALILGAIVFFVLGSLNPSLIENGITTWFSDAIINIYDTPFFGFIFMVIAVFVLYNAISRGSSILGKLLTGQSFKEATAKASPFQNFNFQGNLQKRFGNEETIEAEFTEYEEVVEEETESNN
ncbi:hypothetical protein DNU06_14295 [Putridiphycobacter roseus]|uniref:Uncharacterized protein n=1 Tax=Putridiphycobacter roseus TaxID=2219161 RepID=A0A2W1MXM9_9FLAO|nr:hypothetical protein [Putridiphycobacter roseus]PZE16134.1 hypothetical protein DNU06_14295 [Putridiphycobacter roseus]